MTAQKAQQGRVSSPQGRFHGATQFHPAISKAGFICFPIHHCSILLQSDRRERVRLPERRRLPRNCSL
jgi:hypothetical protein